MEYKLVTPQEVSTYTFYGIPLSMPGQRTEEVEPRTQTSFPFREEPASIGIPMPSSEARLGETQSMYRMSGHEAIRGPQHPPQPLPIEQPSMPREEVCASSMECHT